MKTILVTLLLALVLSTNVYAKKVKIMRTFVHSPPGTPSIYTEETGGQGCTYQLNSCFHASFHAHRGQALSLELVVGDSVTEVFRTWNYDMTITTGVDECPSEFSVENGKAWSINWVIASTKGKGRIVDAHQSLSSVCLSQ